MGDEQLVLVPERSVKAPFAMEDRDRRRCRARAKKRHGGIARHEVDDEEDDQGQTEERNEPGRGSPNQIPLPRHRRIGALFVLATRAPTSTAKCRSRGSCRSTGH